MSADVSRLESGTSASLQQACGRCRLLLCCLSPMYKLKSVSTCCRLLYLPGVSISLSHCWCTGLRRPGLVGAQAKLRASTDHTPRSSSRVVLSSRSCCACTLSRDASSRHHVVHALETVSIFMTPERPRWVARQVSRSRIHSLSLRRPAYTSRLSGPACSRHPSSHACSSSRVAPALDPRSRDILVSNNLPNSKCSRLHTAHLWRSSCLGHGEAMQTTSTDHHDACYRLPLLQHVVQHNSALSS